MALSLQRSLRLRLAMWVARRVLRVPLDCHQSYFGGGKAAGRWHSSDLVRHF